AFNVDVLQGVNPTTLHGNDGAVVFVPPLQQESIFSPSTAVLDSRVITTAEEVRRALAQNPLPDGVLVGSAVDGVLVSISGNALFDSGKADLKPAGLAVLDVLANQLRPTTNQIRIEGHTDNIAISTPLFPSNWELSAARATTVVRYLIERGGIRPQQLIAAGYGDQRPVASNDTREGRARNRRVDVVILTPRGNASQSVPDSLPSLGQLP
ncbi:MAG: chemotaxis protein MotB, partial [Chloroflexota bacterium]|nr:chemotaxis protein MotB [Chloroflexota bacterium]